MVLVTLLALITLSEIFLGILVYNTDRKSTYHRYFLCFSVAVIIWTLSNYFSDTYKSLFWTKSTYVGSTLIVTFLILFSNSLPSIFVKFRKWINYYVLSATLLLLVFIWYPSTWFIKTITPYGEGINVVTGTLYVIYPIVFFVSAVIALVLIIERLRKASGKEKLQLRYLLFGVVSSLIIGFLMNSIIPLITSNYSVTRYGPFCAVLFIAFTSYSIVAHQLMDVRLVLRKSSIYFALCLFSFGMFYLVVFLDNHFFGGIYSTNAYLSAIFIAPLFLFAFTYANKVFRRVANRYFFASLYDSEQVAREFGNRITSTIQLSEVATVIIGVVQKAMRTDNIAIILSDTKHGLQKDRVVQCVGYTKDELLGKLSNSVVRKFLYRDHQTVLVDDYSDAQRGARDRLRKIGVALSVPFISKNEVVCHMLLGVKVSHDAYSKEDVDLLKMIANQAAIAVENAKLYKQIQEFNKNLQKKVDEQTSDITRKNENLQQLLKMKSEFLSIASHQLRTPLTAIRGLLAMQADGDFDSFPKDEQKKEQQNMLESANRLSNIVNDLLDSMELEGGNLNFKFAEIQIEELITEVCKELKPNYNKKKLYLKFDPPKPPLPKIEAEPKMLRETIMNTIDNAEKYTNEGGTTITTELKGDTVVLKVTDTGIGIPKSDYVKLFHKFSRGEKSVYQHTDGSGLGLFIAKSVITEHHGTIDIASPGEGKGTTVTITLPIHQPKGSRVVTSASVQKKSKSATSKT